MHKRQLNGTFIALFAVGAAAALLITPFIGMTAIPWEALGHSDAFPAEHRLFWMLRVPRTLTAFLAGGALALSGMCFQALFRNPLATPYTLGVSSGASLGVALCLRLGLTSGILGVSSLSVGAFAGAACAIALVYGLTQRPGGCSTATMLLAGVAVSLSFSSLILFMQYISDFANSFRVVRWLMGGVSAVGYKSVVGLTIASLAGGCVTVFHLNELNLLTVGEEFAASRGASVEKCKSMLFFGVSLMVGGVVACCGPIGFIGMICPHVCRLLMGANHRRLAPASFLFGGTFLLLCDTVARSIVAPAEIPVGVITALLGGPFFLWLLLGHSPVRRQAMTVRRALFSFQGRMCRRDYWRRGFLVLLPIGIANGILARHLDNHGARALSIGIGIVSIWPSLALVVKRLHDRNRSGWFAATMLIPLANIVFGVWILIEVWFLRGTVGPNRFGDDPLRESA